MIWGDQWLCPCGWYNHELRRHCRNCGEEQLPGEKMTSPLTALESKFTLEQRERMCRAALEPHGLIVTRFWLTEDGLGHCEAKDHKGTVFLFNQKYSTDD